MVGFFPTHAKGVKHLFLEFALEDPYGATANLISVQHHIVSICLDIRIRMLEITSRIRYRRIVIDHRCDLIRLGCSKRMMTGYPAVALFTVFEQWKVKHP